MVSFEPWGIQRSGVRYPVRPHIVSSSLIQEGQLSVTGERNVHEVLVKCKGGPSLPRKSVVRLSDPF